MIRLLAVSPGDGGDLRSWLDGLSRVRWPAVLLREPTTAEPEALLRLARARVPIVVVHARTPGGAALAAEHGLLLHVPADAPAPATGAWAASAHSEDEVDARLAAGAAYVVWSPVAAPTSKPSTRPPLGEGRFLAHARGRPVLALGGVTPDLAGRLFAGGAAGVAVLGGLGRSAEHAGAYVDRAALS